MSVMTEAQSKRDAALRRLRITTRAIIVAAAAAGAVVMELAHASTPNAASHAVRDQASAGSASQNVSGNVITHGRHRHRLAASAAPTTIRSSGSGSGSVTSGPS
jgi:hypothetical protein